MLKHTCSQKWVGRREGLLGMVASRNGLGTNHKPINQRLDKYGSRVDLGFLLNASQILMDELQKQGLKMAMSPCLDRFAV